MGYQLYYAPGTESFAVHWMLVELGVEFTTHPVDFAADAQHSADYLRLNRSGRVPTLVVDGVPRHESAALLMLLAERHPSAGLAPAAGAPGRAAWLESTVYLANNLAPAMRDWFYAAAGNRLAASGTLYNPPARPAVVRHRVRSGRLDRLAQSVKIISSMIHHLLLPFLLLASTVAVAAQEVDILSLFAAADAEHRVGLAAKTRAVDGRPALVGEIIVTLIKGESVETRSKPAEAGDLVVRNRCPESGNEEYLVKANRVGDRYGAPTGAADAGGWREYAPKGVEMRYFTLATTEGPWNFTAPWGEAMVAKPGDAIVQDPKNPKDTYRIAIAAFRCSYAVTRHPA